MAETRRKFDEDFKEGAVRLVRETRKPIAQVARELGINEGTLGNWVGLDRRRREGGGGRLSTAFRTRCPAGRWACRGPGSVSGLAMPGAGRYRRGLPGADASRPRSGGCLTCMRASAAPRGSP